MSESLWDKATPTATEIPLTEGARCHLDARRQIPVRMGREFGAVLIQGKKHAEGDKAFEGERRVNAGPPCPFDKMKRSRFSS